MFWLYFQMNELTAAIKRQSVILLAFLAVMAPRLCLAKPVELSWKKIKRATRYELLIEDEQKKTVLSTTLPRPDWSGDLPFGAYTFEVRGYDQFNRPGDWSKPKALVVMPPRALLTEPQDDRTFKTFAPSRTVALRWKSEAHGPFLIEVRRDGAVVFSGISQGKQLALKNLTPGRYEWTVKARFIAAGKAWESEGSSKSRFMIQAITPRLPGSLAPTGKLSLPGENAPTTQVRFEWDALDGASAYELTLRSSSPGIGPQSFKTRGTAINLHLPVYGHYHWSVRAIDSDGVPGDVANADFDYVREPLGARRLSLAPELSLDFIHYTETQPSLQPLNFSETALTLHAPLRYRIADSNFELGSDPSLTMTPLSASSSDSVRYLDLDFKGGYSPVRTGLWKLTLYLGLYYESMMVSSGSFGFNSVSGPVLESDVTYRLDARGNRLKFKALLEPVSSGTGIYGLSSLKDGMSVNLELPRAHGPDALIQAGFSHSQLGFDVWQTSTTIYGVGVGLCF